MHYPLETISKNISEQKISPIYLLYGSETFLMEEAISLLKKSLDENASISYASFNGEETAPLKDIIALCNTAPFLASRRLIIIRNIHKLAGHSMSSLLKYVENPSRSTTLILTIEEQMTSKEGKKKIETLSKTFSLHGTILAFDPLKKNALVSWIQQRVKNKGKEIDPSAIYLLIEVTGSNTWSLAAELDKLCLYVGTSRIISPSVVEQLVMKTHESSIFDFLNALFSKKKTTLIKLQELELAGLEPLMVVNMIENQAIQHYQVFKTKDMSETTLKINPFVREKILSHKSFWNLNQLGRLLSDIRKIEHEIKTGASHPFASMAHVVSTHIFEKKHDF